MRKISCETAIEYLNKMKVDILKTNSKDSLSVQAFEMAIHCLIEQDTMEQSVFDEYKNIFKDYLKDLYENPLCDEVQKAHILALTDKLDKMERPNYVDLSAHKGVWDVTDDDTVDYAKVYNCRRCSCKVSINNIDGEMNFCPNCGGAMKVVRWRY